jgi:hypothetical protein
MSVECFSKVIRENLKKKEKKEKKEEEVKEEEERSKVLSNFDECKALI